ncbi:MAG: proton-conducting transporter membrane subunit [Candidatus Sedimenticola sp. 20ELBAFRAG]
MSELQLLTWIPLVPLLAAVGVVVTGKSPNLREAVTIISGVILFALVATLGSNADWANSATLVLAEPLPGVALAFELEPLGLLFAMVASFLWPVTTVYAIGYMRSHNEDNQTRFYAAFAVSIAAVMGIALSANMLTLFLFYEILTLATYPLVTHAGNDKARHAGRIYLGILIGTSIVFLLLAMIWTWQIAGTLDFTSGGVFPEGVDTAVLSVLLVLYVFGTGKAAVMPFHRWLPAAMVAPTPVSALLHAVAVVKAGVFTILKVSVYIFGIDTIADLAVADWLAGLAALTILLASLVAMTKDNLKARLAYSTVSQLGYIVLGAMLGVAAGVVGGGMHIAMHAFGKITLFFCAGAIMVAAHKTKVSELNGLGRRMPLTMLAFLIGALSIVGLPPFGGTWSKWMLVQGTLDTGIWMLTAVLLLSSLLNVAYLVVIPVRSFFTEPAEPAEGVKEAPLASLLAIGVVVTGCLLLFLWPEPIYQLMDKVLK